MSQATSLAFALFRAADAPTFLRRVLILDAVTSGAMGLMLIVGAAQLGPLLGLPVELLWAVGYAFIPFVALVAVAAARPGRTLGMTVGLLNAGWVVASIGALVSGALSPNLLGMAFVAGQAIFVGVLAELQIIGARRL
jgi:multisubunit Na+/H+ antiporter MnhF subunit